MMDIELIKQREEIFDAYRVSIKNIDTLKKEIAVMRSNEERLHESMNKAQKEYSKLAGLIDIMLREDCDPVTAKLKFSHMHDKMEPEEVVYQISSSSQSINKYNYNYNKHSTSSDMYDRGFKTSIMNEVDAPRTSGLWARINAMLGNGGR